MAAKKSNKPDKSSRLNAKTENLSLHTEDSAHEFLTTNHGVRINYFADARIDAYDYVVDE